MSFRQARGKIALIRVASAILPESFLPSSNSYLAEHDAQWIVRLAMSLFWSNAANCLIRGFSHTPRAIFFRSSVIQTGPACLGHQLQTFASTAAVLQKSETAETQEKEAKNVAEAQNQDRKAPRKSTAKTSSLRRVAVEAQRSRGFVRGKGSKRFIDPDVDTKVRALGKTVGSLY